MSIHAVVPVKPFEQAKSRLGEVLTPQQRAALSAWMLANTLRCLRSAPEVAAVTVVSRDPEALSIAGENGAGALIETVAGLNPALHQAAGAVGRERALLVLPADLPLLSPSDLLALIGLAQAPDGMVIAADRHCLGTNALLLTPGIDFRFHFGAGSFQAHQQEARRLGLRVQLASLPNLAFDLDTPDDLRIFQHASLLGEQPGASVLAALLQISC